MQTWLEILKPNTKYIKINHINRSISLIHPHWSKDKDKSIYRQLLKAIKQNPFKSYTVSAIGFMSVDGLIILNRLQNFIDKLPGVETTELKHNIHQGMYTLIVKFK